MIIEFGPYEALSRALAAYEEARKGAIGRFERSREARTIRARIARAKRRLAESRDPVEAKALT